MLDLRTPHAHPCWPGEGRSQCRDGHPPLPRTTTLTGYRPRSHTLAANSRSKRRRKNGHPRPEFDLRTEAYKLFGVDVSQIPGLEENALPLFSEVGRDMSRWPSVGNFVSWLALCPDNDISGGKLLWRGARKFKNRAGHLFIYSAWPLMPFIAAPRPWATTCVE